MTELYRLIIRNNQGEVEEKIECLRGRILSAIHNALDQGFSVTINKIEKNTDRKVTHGIAGQTWNG